MKIGVVGYGAIGKRHAANLRALGHSVLVYDPIMVGGADVQFERNIYETCEAVVVATPSQFHESGLRAAVERERHCLVEKPISVALGGLTEILDSAGEKNLVVMMGNNLRLHPCVQQAKQWITAGYIGKPLWSNFVCAQKTEKPAYQNDGVILNWGSHEVDAALHLLGPAEVISASARCGDHGGDEIADFVIEHESGARSSFHLDFLTPNEIREFWIAGDENNIGVSLPRRSLSLGESVNTAPGSYEDDYRNEMSAFVDRIAGKTVPGATGEDGLATLRVLLDVRKKAGLSA